MPAIYAVSTQFCCNRVRVCFYHLGNSIGLHLEYPLIYTLTETFELYGVDTQVLLTDELSRSADHKFYRIDELQPCRYAQKLWESPVAGHTLI